MTNSQILATARPLFKETMTNHEYQQRLYNIRRQLPHGRVKTPYSSLKHMVRDDDYFDSRKILISGVIQSIRSNKSDYVFSEDQVVDLLRYEPNMKVTYEGGSYWLVSC